MNCLRFNSRDISLLQRYCYYNTNTRAAFFFSYLYVFFYQRPSACSVQYNTTHTRLCAAVILYHTIYFFIGPYGRNLLLSNIVMTVIIYAYVVRVCVM